MIITRITTGDKRFHLKEGEGVDSVHSIRFTLTRSPIYIPTPVQGIGITFNLGRGRT